MRAPEKMTFKPNEAEASTGKRHVLVIEGETVLACFGEKRKHWFSYKAVPDENDNICFVRLPEGGNK